MSALAIEYLVDSGLALITLADGQGGNRLNPDSLVLLRQSLERALDDAAVRLIALRSIAPAGTPFCLGMDLDSLQASLSDGGQNQQRRAAVIAYGELLERIGSCAKPVIALVGGPVKAGGVGLVAACDIVLASSSASFELSEVLFGLIPANVLPYLLQRRMGLQKARYLILSARCLDAAEAQAVGLVDQISQDQDAEAMLKTMCKTMMRAEPEALAETKRFLCQAEQIGHDELRSTAIGALLNLMDSPAVSTALQAFASGGTPPWFGRFKPTQSIFWRNNA